MILHKYLDADGAIPTLQNCELKVTPPYEFNDPFDCLQSVNENWSIKYLQRILLRGEIADLYYNDLISSRYVKNKKEYKEKIRDKDLMKKYFKNTRPMEYVSKHFTIRLYNFARIACFSSANADEKNQILMWSHYSKGHTGVRLHFDSDILIKDSGDWNPEGVTYNDKREAFELRDFVPLDNLNEKIKKILLTKSKAWEYESEYRVFIQRGNCRETKANKDEKCNPVYLNTEKADSKAIFLAKFNPTALRCIDFGVNCLQSTKNKIIESLNRPELKHVEVYQSKLDEKEFKLNFEEYKRAT